MGLLAARRGSLHPRRASGLTGPDYATEVAADSPVAWWRLSETSGSTTADEIGSNDGTVTGADLSLSGLSALGSAANFDGTDDRILISGNSLFPGGSSNPWTLELWLNADATSANGANRVGFSVASGGDRTYLYTQTNFGGASNSLRFFTATIGEVLVGSDIRGDGWTHVVVTSDGTTARLYENAIEVDTRAGGVEVKPGSLAHIGSGYDGSLLYHFFGGIDEVAVYGTALSAARITAHYNAGVA